MPPPAVMARFRLLLDVPKRRRSLWREVQAEMREFWALLRQFWRPLIAFVVIIVAGALLYNLLTPSAEPKMPFARSVYFMLEMLVFGIDPEAFPDDTPRQLFFFVMPVLGLSTVVSGVVGFGAALLNRANRREEWEVALASTYKNHVIVCGVGHLGTRVVRHLLSQGFDVVVIESNPDASGVKETRSYSIPLILKDARLREVLQDAGVEQADTLLVCTDDDMANLAVVIHARELNPTMRIVVRMFNDSLAAQVREKLGADAVYSASMLAAPVFASAATRTEVAQTYTVGDELFSMARLEICEGSPLAGQTIAQIEQPGRLDVVLHISGEHATAHPDADTAVGAGDELVIFARADLLREIANRNRVPNC